MVLWKRYKKKSDELKAGEASREGNQKYHKAENERQKAEDTKSQAERDEQKKQDEANRKALEAAEKQRNDWLAKNPEPNFDKNNPAPYDAWASILRGLSNQVRIASIPVEKANRQRRSGAVDGFLGKWGLPIGVVALAVLGVKAFFNKEAVQPASSGEVNIEHLDKTQLQSTLDSLPVKGILCSKTALEKFHEDREPFYGIEIETGDFKQIVNVTRQGQPEYRQDIGGGIDGTNLFDIFTHPEFGKLGEDAKLMIRDQITNLLLNRNKTNPDTDKKCGEDLGEFYNKTETLTRRYKASNGSTVQKSYYFYKLVNDFLGININQKIEPITVDPREFQENNRQPKQNDRDFNDPSKPDKLLFNGNGKNRDFLSNDPKIGDLSLQGVDAKWDGKIQNAFPAVPTMEERIKQTAHLLKDKGQSLLS